MAQRHAPIALRISHMVTIIWAVVVADIATDLFLLDDYPDISCYQMSLRAWRYADIYNALHILNESFISQYIQIF